MLRHCNCATTMDFVALFSEKQAGRKIALSHNITMAVNEYNKGVSVKKWKVDASQQEEDHCEPSSMPTRGVDGPIKSLRST